MRILFDSKNKKYKTPFGCIKRGEKCSLNIYIPTCCGAQLVSVHLERDDGFKTDFSMKKLFEENSYTVFGTSFELDECGLYFYRFDISTSDSSFKLMKYGFNDTNIEEGELWQLTCLPEDYAVPDDFKGKVMYQIFPDRFYKYGSCDLDGKLGPYHIHKSTDELPEYMPNDEGKILNNDFFGGNLRGIENKLPYLKELGVSVIYINPIFKAFSNHRYDTCDYKCIDPMLGTQKDFENLCAKAHENGMKIILDGVFSHTGCDSIYFDKYNRFGTGVISNPNSEYNGWYSFEKYPDKYNSWWGIDTLPCVNELSPGYLSYIITGEDSVVKHWLRAGADGFRLDVADELPDEFIKILRETVKNEKPGAVVLGEVWEDASNKIAYGIRRKYFSDAELDSVMNYPFRNAIISLVKGTLSAEQFASSVLTIAENYPSEVLHCLMNSLSTHDTERIITSLTGADMSLSREDKANYVFSEQERAKAFSLLKTAVFLQFFLPGCPCIYYGDEIGMEGFNDPFNRAFFKWNDINDEIHEFYKYMAKIKNSNDELKFGDISFLTASDGVLVMERCAKKSSITAAVNLSGEAVRVSAGKVLLSHNSTCLDGVIYIQKGGFVLYK